jgi:hypothetical protein
MSRPPFHSHGKSADVVFSGGTSSPRLALVVNAPRFDSPATGGNPVEHFLHISVKEQPAPTNFD